MQDKEFLKAIKGMSEIEWRTSEKVIALIEKRQNEIKYLLELRKKGDISKSQEYRLNKLTEFSKDWLFFNIEEVDISRKWVIREYDSSTYIKYLDLEDEKLNFYGFI